MSATRILKLATTNRHWNEMRDTVDGYLVGTLTEEEESWQKGYDTVISWHECGQFENYDAVELYVTSRPLLNAGIITAFDDCGIPLSIKEHISKGNYKTIRRNRWALMTSSTATKGS